MRSAVLYQIVKSIKTILLSIAAFFSLCMPAFAKYYADSIDLLPYFECFGAGLLLGVALSRGMVLLARKRIPGLTSIRVWNWLPAIVIFLPPWAVFLGLGANRWLDLAGGGAPDRDPGVEVLGQNARALPRHLLARPRLGRVTFELIYAAEATSPERAVPGRRPEKDAWVNPRACVPGTPLIVASHPGALGWDWIEYVRVPEAPAGQSERP